jgi:hypothetical protein
LNYLEKTEVLKEKPVAEKQIKENPGHYESDIVETPPFTFI